MIAIFAWSAAIIATIPSFVLSCELIAGVARNRARTRHLPPRPPIAILMPAHDEAAGIARPLSLIRQQLRAGDRLVVIADNCSDDTAKVARLAGAEVVERTNPARGKAYALAYGREAIRTMRPAVVLVIDADCEPAPHAIATLVASVRAQDAVVQARYLLECSAKASPLVRISTFAFLIKNFVRQRGLQRLCGTALLQGSGMGFPWRIFEDAPLQSTSLVEDMELGLELALLGHRIRFEPRARFVSTASSQRATLSQRTRWEHGALGIATKFIPRLLVAGMARRPGLIVLAADLTVPPLALFITLQSCIAAMLLLVSPTMGTRGPAELQIAAFALTLFALALSWAGFGRLLVPIRTLPSITAYMVWKLPIYVGYLFHRQRHWVRTDRAP